MHAHARMGIKGLAWRRPRGIPGRHAARTVRREHRSAVPCLVVRRAILPVSPTQGIHESCGMNGTSLCSIPWGRRAAARYDGSVKAGGRSEICIVTMISASGMTTFTVCQRHSTVPSMAPQQQQQQHHRQHHHVHCARTAQSCLILQQEPPSCRDKDAQREAMVRAGHIHLHAIPVRPVEGELVRCSLHCETFPRPARGPAVLFASTV